MPITKLTQLEREATRLDGERGAAHRRDAPRPSGKIAEIELQILQIDRDLSSEVGRDLREAEAKIGEFVERKVAAEDQLKRHRHPRAAGRRRASARPCTRSAA